MIQSLKNQPIKQDFFNRIAKEFDNHVRQSIPLYGDFIDNVRQNLCSRENRTARILDLCGSTGKFGFDLLNTGKFKGSYINLDGAPKMIEISKKLGARYPGQHISLLGGFMSGWTEDDGTEIKLFDTKGKYFDVVLELLGFQFFTPDREVGIIEIKKSMCPHGIAIFCEKFSNTDRNLWQKNEDLKDSLWKSQFFTPEEIEAKKRNVLADMGEYCYELNNFRALLKKHFTYVKEVYKAGNFAGFVCSNTMFRWRENEALTNNVYNASVPVEDLTESKIKDIFVSEDYSNRCYCDDKSKPLSIELCKKIIEKSVYKFDNTTKEGVFTFPSGSELRLPALGYWHYSTSASYGVETEGYYLISGGNAFVFDKNSACIREVSNIFSLKTLLIKVNE